MKRITIGILAHVDSGKTTLSEAILYKTGSIRSLGRVDHKNAFLDTHSLEKERGITIFSKQAEFNLNDTRYTLMDTPGHTDFSTETERTLQVIDCAILVVSGPDPIQSHTETLWELLKRYRIPTFIFVNKNDLPDVTHSGVMYKLKKGLSDSCIDFTDTQTDPFKEQLSLCTETLMEEYLDTETFKENSISEAIMHRKVFPCMFGSALKTEGVEDFLNLLDKMMKAPAYTDRFGARIFKISSDEQGTRLTHMKITGGALKVKDLIDYTANGEQYKEKINQIRIYSGKKYTAPDVAGSGTVCAVTGLTATYPGMGLGAESSTDMSVLEPVLSYNVFPSNSTDNHTLLQQLKILEQEDPKLHVTWDKLLDRIKVHLMGQIQLEIIHDIMQQRFGSEISFSAGEVSYRETIGNAAEGVGHYEPLRHYAEVHLLLEPMEQGSGLVFETDCREDKLSRNWQNLILTHLKEKEHLGVLTGSPITDMKITLKSGKAHLKHTEGGDFRQATYRAVRQGLMKCQPILLEPFYRFKLIIPSDCVGRAINDIQNMSGTFSSPELSSHEQMSVIHGEAPVSEMNGYHSEVQSYTKGRGRLSCTLSGFKPCHNSEEIIIAKGYDPEGDTENTPDSVFCTHGSGYIVKWNEVENKMHLPSCLEAENEMTAETEFTQENVNEYKKALASDKELMEIFERTYGPIKRDKLKAFVPKKDQSSVKFKAAPVPEGPEYLLVDGYNVIFAWEELNKLSKDNLDLARNCLINTMCNYQGFKQCEVIVVFDAYKMKNPTRNIEKIHNISVVYTKEAETADMYIEKVTHEIGKKHRVRVATSDNLEQIIILGNGAYRISATEFEKEVRAVEKAIREYIL